MRLHEASTTESATDLQFTSGPELSSGLQSRLTVPRRENRVVNDLSPVQSNRLERRWEIMLQSRVMTLLSPIWSLILYFGCCSKVTRSPYRERIVLPSHFACTATSSTESPIDGRKGQGTKRALLCEGTAAPRSATRVGE